MLLGTFTHCLQYLLEQLGVVMHVSCNGSVFLRLEVASKKHVVNEINKIKKNVFLYLTVNSPPLKNHLHLRHLPPVVLHKKNN